MGVPDNQYATIMVSASIKRQAVAASVSSGLDVPPAATLSTWV
jgi:hypothetical protein